MQYYNNCREEDKEGKSQILGEGSYGVVYKCSGVAEKRFKNTILKSKYVDVGDITEIAILKKVQHPNILKILGTYLLPEKIFMYTPIAKTDLYKHIQTLSPVERSNVVFDYMDQIFRGIRYLHKNMIVHSDIKPKNVLVDTNGKLLLADFGLSSISYSGFYTNIRGTIAYWPPYVFQNSVTGKKHDVWSAGATAYYIFTGEPMMPLMSFKGWKGLVDIYFMNIRQALGPPPESFIKGIYHTLIDDVKNYSTYLAPEYTKIGKIKNKPLKDLLIKILQWEAEDIPTADEVLQTYPLNEFQKKDGLENVIIKDVIYPDRFNIVHPFMFEMIKSEMKHGYNYNIFFNATRLLHYIPKSIITREYLASVLLISCVRYPKSPLNNISLYMPDELKKEEKETEQKTLFRKNISLDINQALIQSEFNVLPLTSYDCIELIGNLGDTVLYSLAVYLLTVSSIWDPAKGSEKEVAIASYMAACNYASSSEVLLTLHQRYGPLSKYKNIMNHIINNKGLLEGAKYKDIFTVFDFDVTKLYSEKVTTIDNLPRVKTKTTQDNRGPIFSVILKAIPFSEVKARLIRGEYINSGHMKIPESSYYMVGYNNKNGETDYTIAYYNEKTKIYTQTPPKTE